LMFFLCCSHPYSFCNPPGRSRPKLYWGKKVVTNRRKPLVSSSSTHVDSNSSQIDRRGRQNMSPRRTQVNLSKGFSTKGPSTEEDPLSTKNHLSPPMQDEEIQDQSCGSLSLLRRHHNIMRGRSRRDHSPIPPLPLEIITTGIAPVSPVQSNWKELLYTRSTRDEGISPLPGPAFGIEIDEEVTHSPLAPRIIFCGTTVGGESESEAARTGVTEYGSI